MATEIVTPYPLPPFRDDNQFAEWQDREILRRLGTIEDRLSKIEQQITKQQPTE